MSPTAKDKGTLAAIYRELYIAWRFIDNDIYDTTVPSLIAFFTAYVYAGGTLNELPIRLFSALVYAVLYIYTFCISNQLAGIEEDRINKPYRPLPTGLVTVKETWRRLVAYNCLYLAVAWLLEIFWYSMAWIIVSLCLNLFGWSNHWVSKNLLGMTIGTFILLNVQWAIAQPAAPPGQEVLLYMLFLSLWAGFALPLQDLRDVEGDMKNNRKTLPISIGDKKARLLLAINFSTLTPFFFVCAILTQVRPGQLFSNTAALVMLLAVLAVHACIACRVLLFKTPAEDHRTYLMYVFLFCAGIPVICMI